MSTKKEDKNIIVDRERFEMLSSLFFELNGEIVIFSRKKSDKVLSEFQTQKINQVLEPIQDMMKDEPYAEFLELIPEPSIEKSGRSTYVNGLTYGDVAMMFSEYRSAIGQYRKKHFPTVIDTLSF
jgi:hypothetical protein